jgi:hypothetical protein
VDGAERWEQDVGVVRALDLVQVGAEGVVSAASGAVLSLLPIGTTLMRLSLLSALMVGLSGFLAFHTTHRLVQTPAATPGRTLLSLSGALVAVLASSWQSSAVSVGGPALAGALGLLWTLRLSETGAGRQGTLRDWIGHGALLGVLILESRGLAVCACLLLGLHTAVRLQLPSLREVGFATIALVVVVAVGVLPSLLDTSASGFMFGLGLRLPHHELGAGGPSLLDEVGPYLLALAVAGAASCVLRARHRAQALPLIGWCAMDVALDLREVHLVAVIGLGALSSSGLADALGWLRRARLPFTPVLTQVVFVVHLCALLLLIEGAEQRAGQRTLSATSQWTEEAFAHLPARSLLLVSSPEAAWRLWAARVTSGVRPDVVLVPASLLSHEGWAAELLRLEPKLAPLVRDVAVAGRPGEYALTELADARPLRVEVDPQWDKRLLRHLSGDGLWFRFAPHATGRTDRYAAQASVDTSLRRVHRAAASSSGRDERTLARLRQDIYRQAAVAVLLRDSDNVELLTRSLERLGISKDELRALDDRELTQLAGGPLSLLPTIKPGL